MNLTAFLPLLGLAAAGALATWGTLALLRHLLRQALRAAPGHCRACGVALTAEEAHFLDTHCEPCEATAMARGNAGY